MSDMPAWMADALCPQIGPKAWDLLSEREQISVCAGCPVREPCAELGIEQAPEGRACTIVFGGLGASKIAREAKRRRMEVTQV